MHPLLLALVVVAEIWLAIIAALVIAGRKGMAREVAAFLPNLLALFRGLLRDPRVPRSAKVLLFLAIGWIVSPIDLIPEFIPVAGPLDDAVVAVLVLRQVIKVAGPGVVREHWRGGPSTVERLLRLAGGGVEPDIAEQVHPPSRCAPATARGRQAT